MPARLPLPGRMPPITTSCVWVSLTFSQSSERVARRYDDLGFFTTMPSSPNSRLAVSAASTSSNTGGVAMLGPASAAMRSSSSRRSASGSAVTSSPSSSRMSNR